MRQLIQQLLKLMIIFYLLPELSLSENGKPELLFQDAEGILKMESLDNGKSWQTITNNVLEGDSKGSASPSVLRLNSKERLLFYFKAEDVQHRQLHILKIKIL